MAKKKSEQIVVQPMAGPKKKDVRKKTPEWPSWEETEKKEEEPEGIEGGFEEVQEEKEAGFELEEVKEPEVKEFKTDVEREHAGVMVIYEKPGRAEGAVIEINAPGSGKMKLDLEVELGPMAKMGLVMAIIGAIVTIAGIASGVWYGTNQMLIEGSYHWDPIGFSITLVLLGIGAVLLFLGVVLTTYGRRIRQK